MSIQEIPNDNLEFNQAAMNAWNSLTVLIDNEDDSLLYETPESFKEFYALIMTKLLEETEEE